MKFSVDTRLAERLPSPCDSRHTALCPARTHDAPVRVLSRLGSHLFGSDEGRGFSFLHTQSCFPCWPLIGWRECSLAAAVKRIREGPQLRELQQARQKRMFKCRKAELLREHGTLENMETSDPDTSSQSDSENHPATLPRNPYSSATRQACLSIRNYGRQVERRCCGCVQRFHKLRSVFRFLNSSDSNEEHTR